MLTLPEVIAAVPALSGTVSFRSLSNGPTSNTWLLNLPDSGAVVRIDKPLARLLCLDRERELGVLEKVAHAGFGPEVMWADPLRGVLITRYIPGEHLDLSHAVAPANICRLALRVRELHDTPMAVPVIEVAETASRYASVTHTVQTKEILSQVAILLKRLRTDLTKYSLCHNDLGSRNIIDAAAIRFIDWEYSAACNPCFELAGVVRQNNLSVGNVRLLLRSYFGTADKELERRFSLFSRLYDLVSALWYLAVCAADERDLLNRRLLLRTLVRLRQSSGSLPRRVKIN